MSAADRSTKDKQMAAHLKAEGVTRDHCRCPMCHAVIPLTRLYGHLSTHGGRAMYGSEEVKVAS